VSYGGLSQNASESLAFIALGVFGGAEVMVVKGLLIVGQNQNGWNNHYFSMHWETSIYAKSRQRAWIDMDIGLRSMSEGLIDEYLLIRPLSEGLIDEYLLIRPLTEGLTGGGSPWEGHLKENMWAATAIFKTKVQRKGVWDLTQDDFLNSNQGLTETGL
jgi:hypothetical protein